MTDNLLQPRFTPEERRILHALGFVSASRIDDDRTDLVIDGLRRDLAAVARRPDVALMLYVGQSLVSAYPMRSRASGGLIWAEATMDAAKVSQQFHWTALCALEGR